MTKTMYRPMAKPIESTEPVALAFSNDATRLYFATPDGQGTRLERIHASSGALLQDLVIPLHGVNRVEPGPGLGETQVANVSSACVYDVDGRKVDGTIIFSVAKSKVFAVGTSQTRVFDLEHEREEAPKLVVREQRASIRLERRGLVLASCDDMPRVRSFGLIERAPIRWRPQSNRIGWTSKLGLWSVRSTTNGLQLAVLSVEERREKRTDLNMPAEAAIRLDVSTTRMAAVTPDSVMVRIFDEPLGGADVKFSTGPRTPLSMPQLMSELH